MNRKQWNSHGRCRVHIGLVVATILFAALLPAAPAGAQASIDSRGQVLTTGSYRRSGPLPFADLHGSVWESAATPLWRLGILEGVSQDRFAPYDTLTRAQLVVMMIRALGRSDMAVAVTKPPFVDVPVSHPAAGYLAYANRSGLVEGVGDNLFRPDDTVTYAEALTIIYRAAGHAGPATGPWPEAHLQYAHSLGLVEGLKGYGLSRGLLRGDAVLLIYRLVFDLVNPATGTTVSQQVWRVPERLAIHPERTYLPPNAPLRLTALALDASGRPVQTPPVSWRMEFGSDTGASLGPDGTLVLGYGPADITAEAGPWRAQKTFAPLRSLTVEPPTAVIRPGETVALVALATGVNGHQETAAVEWEVLSGPGTVTDQGVLSGDAAGAVEVRARLADIIATARVLVLPGITVEPADPVAFPGEVLDFHALSTDSTLKHLALPVKWAAKGAEITLSGRLVVPAGGEVAVAAMVGPLVAGTVLRIPERIITTPGSLTLVPGEKAAVSARVVDAAGQTLSLPVSWRVEPADLGRATGESFIAITPGSGQLIAESGPLEARIPVIVAPAAPPVRLMVTPDLARADGASTVTIDVTLSPVPGGLPVSGRKLRFAVSGAPAMLEAETAVTDGTGVAKVTLTAGEQAGRVTVRAWLDGEKTAEATATVTLVEPKPARVSLSVEPPVLAADGASIATVTATLVDDTVTPVDNPFGTTLWVDLSPLGPELAQEPTVIAIPPGQSTGSTTLQGGRTPGRLLLLGSVDPTDGSGQGDVPALAVTPVTAQLVRLGPADRLVVRAPYSATGAEGPTWAVAAYIADSDGQVRTGDSGQPITLTVWKGNAVLWSKTITVTGGAATFLLPAGVGGAGKVKLTATAAGLETSEIEFDLGTSGPDRIRLVLLPLPEVPATGGVGLQLRAQVVDAAGRPQPTPGRSITFLRVGEERVTTPTGSTATTTDAQGQAVLTLVTSGRTGHDTWTAVSPGLGTEAAVKVVARAAAAPTRLRWWAPSGPHRVGVPLRLNLSVTDAAGVPLLGSDPAYRSAELAATGAAASWESTAFVAGVAAVTVTTAAPGRLTLTATDPAGKLAPATIELQFTP